MKIPKKLVEELEWKHYDSKPLWKNGTQEFHEFVRGHVYSDMPAVLEIGAGPSNKTSEFLSLIAKRLDGLDIDEAVRTNVYLDQAVVYNDGEFPMNSDIYDLVIADYVLEHVKNPLLLIGEVYRVLRPNGYFIFRTPNIFHYVSLLSRLMPHRYHIRFANRARQREEEASDPYPTFYRFNTTRNIIKISMKTNFCISELRTIEKQPSYLKFNSKAFRIGVLYERAVNSADAFSFLRANIIGALKKE